VEEAEGADYHNSNKPGTKVILNRCVLATDPKSLLLSISKSQTFIPNSSFLGAVAADIHGQPLYHRARASLP
jgi:hypothetical protein